jgi:hypothetical protein
VIICTRELDRRGSRTDSPGTCVAAGSSKIPNYSPIIRTHRPPSVQHVSKANSEPEKSEVLKKGPDGDSGLLGYHAVQISVFIPTQWTSLTSFVYPEDGGRTVLRNVGTYLGTYIVPYTRRLGSSNLSLINILKLLLHD